MSLEREGVVENLTILMSVADTFNAEVAETAVDKNLSTQGRAAGMKRVAMSALAKLNAVETTTIKNLTDRGTSIEQALLGKATYAPPTDAAERISYEMRLQEIRSQLRQLPASERLRSARRSWTRCRVRRRSRR